MLNARSRGLGGGGAMFSPETSPRTPFTIFLASDGAGLYRSDSGGEDWQLLDERIVQGSRRFSVAFHPAEDKIIAYHPQRGFAEGTHDLDTAWTHLFGLQTLKYPAVGMPMGNACSTSRPGVARVAPRTTVALTAAGYCPDDPGSVLIGTERGIARFDGEKISWVFPVDPGTGSPSTFDDYAVPDVELGGGVANAAEVLRFVTLPDPMQPGRWLYFVATTCDVLTSYDQGRTWTSIAAGLPGRSLGLVQPGRPQDTQAAPDASYSPSRFRSFVGGAGDGYYALFVTLSITDELTLSSGGVWAYDGFSWRRAMGGSINTFSLASDPSSPKPAIPATAGLYLPRYEHLGASARDPSAVYVTCQNTALTYPAVYRGSYDRASNMVTWAPAYDGVATHTQPAPQPGGGTLIRNVQPSWVERDFGWAFGGPATGFAVAAADPKRAVFTNRAAAHMTKNGGANAGTTPTATQPLPRDWASICTLGSPDTPPWWESGGIDARTVWNYYVPQGLISAQAHFRANADLGVTRSIDSGDTWRSQRSDCQSGTPPASCATSQFWPHAYELAFGQQSGQNAIWAAVSDLGGIPIDIALGAPPDARGAVLVSLDNGETWSALPAAGLPTGPVTSVLRTSSSVYAAVWFNKAANTGGVYRLDDGATSWVQVGSAAPGRLPYRLAMDPVDSRKLYCLVQGDGAGTKSGVYSVIGSGAWTAEGPIEAFSPSDLIVNQSLASGKTELYVTSAPSASKNGDVWKLVEGIWKPLGAFVPTRDAPSVRAFSLAFVEDMAYASSLTHGVRCARRADVEGFDGTAAVDWIDYHAIPIDRVTRITAANDHHTGRSQLYLGTIGNGAYEVQRQIYFVLEKSTFGREDFNVLAGGGTVHTYEKVLWVVLDGFLPKELGAATIADLNARKPDVVVANAPGISIGAVGDALVEVADQDTGVLPPDVAQRIVFPVSLTVDLGQGNPFPDPPKPGQQWLTNFVYLSAHADGGHYACDTRLEFLAQAEPFLSNGSIGWLSADTCVFKLQPGSKVAFDQDLADGKPLDFLAKVLAHLNDPSNQGASGAFDAMRDGGPSVLELSTKENGANAYNFALARVHYLASGDAASDVSVFFRIFSAAFTGFNYDPQGAYQLDTTGRVPLLGVKVGPGETGEVVSIPCFGSPRVEPGGDMSLQSDGLNFHQAISAKGASDSVRYFGCWLDFNQQTPLFPRAPGAGPGPFAAADRMSIQELIRGRHQCLVVEINVPGVPIPSGATPQSSDMLAQRNLAIVESDNPGSTATHTVQHSFEISAPKPPQKQKLYNPLGGSRAFSAPEDLLLFDWGNLPRDSKARLLLPDVDVSELLALAGSQGPVRFERTDVHTLACSVGDLSYLPLPQSRTRGMVALLAIELPPTVKYDQEFRVVLRQVESRLTAVEQQQFVEMRRRVIGSFEIRIPVQKAAALLEEEERKLAVLSYVQSAIPKDDPWAAVFKEYVGQIAARVDGFGGDSAAIPPSPDGAPRDQPCLASCLRAAWRQFCEGLRAGDVARMFGAVKAAVECVKSSRKTKRLLCESRDRRSS